MPDKNSRPEIQFVGHDDLASNTESAFVVAVITRDEIEAGQYGTALTQLHVLSDSEANVRLYRESLTLMVDGYNDDGRALAEIPEVRAYFRQLVREWPFFLWYLARGNGNITLLLSLLCHVQIVRQSDGSIITDFEEMGEIRAHLEDLFKRGNALFAAYAISHKEIAESASSAVSDLKTAFGGRGQC